MSQKWGILKTEHWEQEEDHKPLRVQFNEAELSEYDKMRGHKMKITEPKTPYEFSDSEEEEKVWNLNQQKIDFFNEQL